MSRLRGLPAGVRALAVLVCLTPALARATPEAPAAPAAQAPTASFAEIAATQDTLKQLQSGGFVLYLRHGNTNSLRSDQFPRVDLSDCATQRPLTSAGLQQAVHVGAALRKARIPIGETHASPLCRVRQTASAALLGQPYTVSNLLMCTANLTAEEKAPLLAGTRHLLAEPVAEETNRLVIGHASILMDLIGYFPKEATLVVFRPRGAAGFDYVASIAPAQWAELLKKGGP